MLPAAIRRKLGLQVGAELEVVLDDDRVVLTPKRPLKATFRQGTNELSGLPELDITGNQTKLTSAQVSELLADFP